MTNRRDLTIAATVIVWISAILTLDHFSTFFEQCWLGVGTWLLLLGLLSREDKRTRLQVAVVVCFATVIEYVFSGWLHVYIYRLHQVPWFVPPGHGLVYLAALAIGRSPWVKDHSKLLLPATAIAVTSYAIWGLVGSGRLDILGAFWAAWLLVFLRYSRQPTVFVGAFIVVTYLELFGTHIGAWAWQVHDPLVHWVAQGNPPSGAAGGYGFFDLAALLVSDAVAAKRRTRAGRLGPIEYGEDLVVEQPVGADDAAAARVGLA